MAALDQDEYLLQFLDNEVVSTSDLHDILVAFFGLFACQGSLTHDDSNLRGLHF